MEQEQMNIDRSGTADNQAAIEDRRQELVKRIKDDCHSKLDLSRWICGFALGMFIVELVWKQIDGTLIEDLTTLLVMLLLTVIIIINYIYMRSVESIGDAKELLRQYDKATYSSLIAILIFAVIQAIRLGLEHNYLLIGKAAAAIAIVCLVGWMFGGFNNKEINRLRKLVKQENEKSGADI